MQIIRRTFDKDPDNPENKLGILVEKEEACRDYDYIMREWEREVKKMIPLNCKYEALPMKFTFTQSEKMRTIIVENMSSFFLVDHKKIVFNLIGRIFNYPNKVP
jgi:centrosomal protein CEP76